MNARRLLPILAVSTLVSCGTPVGPLVAIAKHQSAWRAHRPAAYEFDYQLQAFLAPQYCPTLAYHIVVRGDTVSSATCAQGGQATTGVTVTPDTLFAWAIRMLKGGTLNQIEYDPHLDYPTLLSWNGPPDASGSETISNLRPLPIPVRTPTLNR